MNLKTCISNLKYKYCKFKYIKLNGRPKKLNKEDRWDERCRSLREEDFGVEFRSKAGGQKYLLRGERTKLGKIPKEKRLIVIIIYSTCLWVSSL